MTKTEGSPMTIEEAQAKCNPCWGTGMLTDGPCKACNGSGHKCGVRPTIAELQTFIVIHTARQLIRSRSSAEAFRLAAQAVHSASLNTTEGDSMAEMYINQAAVEALAWRSKVTT